ncbi:MAG TPA: DUF309 domain-containing protein [Thermoanaerobaculia bacterium]|jgi:hypothetical protein|nr:DUF309 domain-containing protein [Thermoanaerobaculia bacterium]
MAELHPVLSAEQRAALVRGGTEHFHAGRFFDAHEAWEEIWRSTTPEPRDLFQGLVQLAAAFHHLQVRRRPDVARRVLVRARRRLAALSGDAGGLDLGALLPQLSAWDAWLAAPVGPAPPMPSLSWRDAPQ